MNACWVAWVTAWSFAGIVALAIVARCVAQLEGGTRGRLTSQFHDMMNGICSSPLVVGVLVFASMVSAIVVACSSVGDRTFRPLEMLSFTVLAPFLLKRTAIGCTSARVTFSRTTSRTRTASCAMTTLALGAAPRKSR